MSVHLGSAVPGGSVGLRVVRGAGAPAPATVWPCRPLSLAEINEHSAPHRGLPDAVNGWRRANARIFAQGLPRLLAARALRLPHIHGQLFLSVLRADGKAEHLGLASLRVVTTAGVRYICDDFNAGASSADVSNMKFHGIGTGTTAEAVGDTALVTEITTAYSTDNTRPTGTQASATVSTNATYTTVGTVTVDAAVAATEHGIFSQAATGGGTLLDRSVFSVVNLASGDSIQATYTFQVNSGG